MAMSALSVVFSVFVLNFHHKRTGSHPPPSWIKFIAKIASVLTCTTINFTTDNRGFSHVNRNAPKEHRTTEYDLINVSQEEEIETCEHLLDIHSNSQCPEGHRNVKSSNNNTNGRAHLPLIENILIDYVNRVLSGFDRSKEECQVVNDWKEIARVFDRVLFLLFAFITCSSTLALLVICPLTKTITIDEFISQN